jgi:hypothetical protein
LGNLLLGHEQRGCPQIQTEKEEESVGTRPAFPRPERSVLIQKKKKFYWLRGLKIYPDFFYKSSG